MYHFISKERTHCSWSQTDQGVDRQSPPTLPARTLSYFRRGLSEKDATFARKRVVVPRKGMRI